MNIARIIIFTTVTVLFANVAFATEEITMEKVGIVFVLIPGGEFIMGSNDGEGDERPEHRVKVDTFYMAKTEVTQQQYEQVMGNNPSEFSDCSNCPVETVPLENIREFIEKLRGLTGENVRLPTEAEWEYAAGGGKPHQKWAGTEREEELSDYAWYKSNSHGRTHPVGQKKPNLFGLYDMSGNVVEWCSDWYGEFYYSSSPVDNPRGPNGGSTLVSRGGSWFHDAMLLRSAYRGWNLPINIDQILGFRLVLSVDQQAGKAHP